MLWKARASVIEVVDGDTFHSDLDIGWGIILRPRPYGAGTVRIVHANGLKYDAPETKTEAGKVARQFARTLANPGSLLEVFSYGIDDFGRTLGAVTLPDGRDWAAVMTEAGFVK